MVTSVNDDQRSSAPEVPAAPAPEQPTAPEATPEAPGADATVPTDHSTDADPTDDSSAADAVHVVDPAEAAGTVDSADPAEPVGPVDSGAGDDPATGPAALAARLQGAEERAAAAEATIATLTERLAELESRADRLEGAARSLERGVAAADDQLESLTARVSELVDAADHDRAGATAIGTEVAELQATVRRLDQGTAVAVAREVERHTTAELLDGQQRLHQTSIAMAGLAQALTDAARQITPELTADSARALLDSFAVDVDLLLQQLGHEALGVTTGDVFDAKRHRALRRVPTADPTADRTIARVIRDGYRTPATDRVLLFADVEVYRVTDPKAAAAHSDSSEKGT